MIEFQTQDRPPKSERVFEIEKTAREIHCDVINVLRVDAVSPVIEALHNVVEYVLAEKQLLSNVRVGVVESIAQSLDDFKRFVHGRYR